MTVEVNTFAKKDMTVLEFINKFSEEKSCQVYYKEVRQREGVVCKKCGNTKHYWLENKGMFECSHCKFRTSLKSGTIMENSRLPLRTWFLIMLFMTSTKKGISACEMQRQIGHSRYATIWNIMHRLRKVMGKRDDLYFLEDMVEFDEGCFEIAMRQNLKRGRGSERQCNVAVMAESTPLEDIETNKKSSSCRYFKMKALKSYKSEEINDVVKNAISENSILFTDKSTSYLDLSEYVEFHVSEKSSNETTNELLKWVHIAISNAKRNMLGVYHSIKAVHLQSYLDEFCYKLNRRYMKSVFERLVVATTQHNLQTSA